MKFKVPPKSPPRLADEPIKFEKRKGIYESDVTALIREMLKDDEIREDQRFAWERWRAEDPPPQK